LVVIGSRNARKPVLPREKKVTENFPGSKKELKEEKMKTLKALIIVVAFVPAVLFGQTRVEASDILDQINNGKAVSYKNAEVVGELNFTAVKDVTEEGHHRWLNIGSSRSYSCHVKSPVSFVNCIFLGDVLAYVNNDLEKETYNAVFHEDVDFEGCEFRRDSAFKYAKFLKKANFENTKYQEEALFKYAKFSTEVSFSKACFYDDANFKYTDFPEAVSFAGAIFKQDADFKYTEFPRGVNFANAEFRGWADFKYTEFSEPVNFDGTVFKEEAEFKYAKVDGRSFILHLLKRK
jgi:uncharacterized protein YjbI with pentapeptide repeats